MELWRPGRPNAHVLADVTGQWEPATVTGRLVPAGWGAEVGFPALVVDEDAPEVHGFLLSSEVLRDHWDRLDDFEGPGYRRVTTTARLQDGSLVAAQVYSLRQS